MELAALVVVPSREDLVAIEKAPSSGPATFETSSRMPILGNDLLRSWIDRVRKLGLSMLWLTAPSDDRKVSTELARVARQGVDRLLRITLKSYAEMDLTDLMRFHCENRNTVTEVKDDRGHLGVSLLDRLALLRAVEPNSESGRAPTATGRPYKFGGYAKRILAAKERQELVGDALLGACAMRPSGTQIRQQVWIGEGASLADSVRVIGPSYIGARTIVRAGATIGPFASVERDCIVDCGTTVEQSTVLPQTYLGPGLLIRGAMVDGHRLEDLRSGIVADLQPAGLGRSIEQPKARKLGYKEIMSDFLSLAKGLRNWDVARSAVSEPWVQVRL